MVLAWCAYLESPCWMTVLAHVPKDMFVYSECFSNKIRGRIVQINLFSKCSDERKNYLEKEICLWALQVSGQKWKSDTTIKKSTLLRLYGIEPTGLLFKIKNKDRRREPGCTINQRLRQPKQNWLISLAAITKGGNTLSQAQSNSWAQSQLGNSV